MTAYDEIRYPSRSYAQTHPDTLAAVASLHGIECAMAGECRVLEIGCGDGTNLLGMAAELPGSQFVGVDLAETPIAEARENARVLDAENASFLATDIAAIRPADLGEFDFIIAHGVFSWVPEPVRHAILDFCGKSLAPAGVAYISYNAYPGCHLREMNRRMMRYHTRHFEDPRQRIEQGRALMHVLVNGRTDKQEAYHRVLEEGLEHAMSYNPAAFFHDDLSETNTPYYFYEFVEMARGHGLQFLAEAELRAMELGGEPSPANDLLERMGREDVEIKEQYLDFLTGRRFRQTLLCRSGLPVSRPVASGALLGLRVAGNIAIQPPGDGAPAEEVFYLGPKDSQIKATAPALRLALSAIASAWPQSVPVSDLVAAAGSDEEKSRLLAFLLKAATGGALECRAQASPLALDPGTRPAASRFARWQVEKTEVVTTLIHHRVALKDALTRHLLRLMDGSRDRNDLVSGLADAVARGDVVIEVAGAPLDGRHAVVAYLRESLESQIRSLARLALVRS